MKLACVYCGNVYETTGKPPHKTVKVGVCELCNNATEKAGRMLEPEKSWKGKLISFAGSG